MATRPIPSLPPQPSSRQPGLLANVVPGRQEVVPTTKTTAYEESGEEWAKVNYQNGFWSSLLRGGTLPLDFIKIFLPEDSSSSHFLSFATDLMTRGGAVFQYNIYDRPNDDIGEDERKRKPAAALGHGASFLARYINPFLPVTRLIFDKDTADGIKTLSQTPLDIFWRLRAFCFDEKGISLKKTFDTVKAHFSDFMGNDQAKSEKARDSMLNLLKPVLGGFGFFVMTAAAPFKIINKFKGEKSRLVDSIYSLAFSTQHLLYFVNYTMHDLTLSRFAGKGNESDDRKASAFKKIFYLGVLTNTVNFLTPVFSLVKTDEDSFIGRLANFLQNTQLTGLYFAMRRYLRGLLGSEELGLIEGPNGIKQREDSFFDRPKVFFETTP